MSQKSIVLIVILFTLIVVGMFGYAYLKRAEIVSEVIVPPVTVDPYASITRVDAKHYYIDGVHTLVGEMVFPTPCDLLESEAIIQESYPEQINISFSVINNSEMCAQMMTNQRFKVSASASPEATFTASLNGRALELNLVPAQDGEVPEDFELFIKG